MATSNSSRLPADNPYCSKRYCGGHPLTLNGKVVIKCQECEHDFEPKDADPRQYTDPHQYTAFLIAHREPLSGEHLFRRTDPDNLADVLPHEHASAMRSTLDNGPHSLRARKVKAYAQLQRQLQDLERNGPSLSDGELAAWLSELSEEGLLKESPVLDSHLEATPKRVREEFAIQRSLRKPMGLFHISRYEEVLAETNSRLTSLRRELNDEVKEGTLTQDQLERQLRPVKEQLQLYKSYDKIEQYPKLPRSVDQPDLWYDDPARREVDDEDEPTGSARAVATRGARKRKAQKRYGEEVPARAPDCPSPSKKFRSAPVPKWTAREVDVARTLLRVSEGPTPAATQDGRHQDNTSRSAPAPQASAAPSHGYDTRRSKVIQAKSSPPEQAAPVSTRQEARPSRTASKRKVETVPSTPMPKSTAQPPAASTRRDGRQSRAASKRKYEEEPSTPTPKRKRTRTSRGRQQSVQAEAAVAEDSRARCAGLGRTRLGCARLLNEYDGYHCCNCDVEYCEECHESEEYYCSGHRIISAQQYWAEDRDHNAAADAQPGTSASQQGGGASQQGDGASQQGDGASQQVDEPTLELELVAELDSTDPVTGSPRLLCRKPDGSLVLCLPAFGTHEELTPSWQEKYEKLLQEKQQASAPVLFPGVAE